ncbi:MAG: hypothetical protein Q9220_004974 [cf. Caloplaca sp. 1 TL-2023]
MPAKRRRTRTRLLSNTRPIFAKKSSSISSQATRSLIRTHHVLQKQLHTALANNDTASTERLRAELAASGGLQRYQEASIQGQSCERGGDTSRVLMEWIEDCYSSGLRPGSSGCQKLRMLEVGALKIDNACSRSRMLDVQMIDLHSQHPGIQQQDFMERPIPLKQSSESEGFDIVSLSLVINYVGDAMGRGEMLKKVRSFLRREGRRKQSAEAADTILPALFLVLPAPCVTNSRYLTEERLDDIMISLGYRKVKRKLSSKLVYYLWHYDNPSEHVGGNTRFDKQEIRRGPMRNNFAIVLQ